MDTACIPEVIPIYTTRIDENGMQGRVYLNSDGRRFNAVLYDTDAAASLPTARICATLYDARRFADDWVKSA